MFFDAHDYAFLRYLEAQHASVEREARGISTDDFIVWEQEEAYQGVWRVFPLCSSDPDWEFTSIARANATRCPKTVEAVQRIPGLRLAALSLLDPHTHIFRHADLTREPTVRCHLGLRIPVGGGMRIGDEIRPWMEGRCLGFDSAAPHESGNTSDQGRLVLLVDVARSEAELAIDGWADPQV